MTTATPKRRWFQFSLRTLLLVVTVGGVLSGWVGSGLREQWRQQRAAREIEKLGGECWLQGRPRWLQSVLGDYCFQSVIDANFKGSHITDAALEHVTGLSELGILDLKGTNVTDAGLEHLQGLGQLRALCLDGTKITDAGLEHLQELDQLESLSLNSTNVTDAGLKYLTGLSRLKYLGLCGSPGVSEEGAGRLKTFLPNCDVNSLEIVLHRFHCSDVDLFLKHAWHYDEGIAEMTKAIEALPYYPKDYRKRGEIYSRKGDKAAAQRDLKKAVELERQEPQRLAIIAGIKAMPRPQRRGFPPGPWALLVLAGLAWLAVNVRQAQRQRSAARMKLARPGQ